MGEGKRVLLADASAESRILLREAMEQTGIFHVDTARTGEEVLQRAAAQPPELLVMDVMLPELDGLCVLRALQEQGTAPLTILISSFVSDPIMAEATELGVAFFLPKPFYPEALLDRMRRLLGPAEAESRPSLKARVTRTLYTLGMPSDLVGYQYLREAILIAAPDISIATSAMTKQLYPEVARRYRTTVSRVERSIRHAIETAWDRASPETLRAYFGETVSASRGKPTNSEFIAMVADRLALEEEDPPEALLSRW